MVEARDVPMENINHALFPLLLLRQPGRPLRQRLDRQPLLALDVRLQQVAVPVHVVTRLGQQRHDFIV